jgi:ABC-type glycerol-3-phosphate transport system permease component
MNRRRVFELLGWSLAAALALTMLVPFLYMISTSLMDELEVFSYPPPMYSEMLEQSQPASSIIDPSGESIIILSYSLPTHCPSSTKPVIASWKVCSNPLPDLAIRRPCGYNTEG